MQAQSVQLYLLGVFYRMKALLASRLASLLPLGSSPRVFAGLSIGARLAKRWSYRVQISPMQYCSQTSSTRTRTTSKPSLDAPSESLNWRRVHLNQHLTHKKGPSLIPCYHHFKADSYSHSCLKDLVFQLRNRARDTTLRSLLSGQNRKVEIFSHGIIDRDLSSFIAY